MESTPEKSVSQLGTPAKLFLLLLLLIVASIPSLSQTSLNHPWSGQAQCKISVQGPGYSHQETHTWTMSGGASTLQGAIHLFPASWSVTGEGSLHKSQGTQTLDAQWTTTASLPNAPIALFIRASDGKLVMKSGHAQLRSKGGVSGMQKVTINGVAQTPGPISVEAFEWAFPGAEVANTSKSISGSSRNPTNGAVGPMQPGGSQGTATCTWNFTTN